MYDIPLITDQIDVAIATKTAGGLKALRDGSAAMYGGAGNPNTVTGTIDAIILTTDPVSPPHTAYTEGLTVKFKPVNTNSGAATIALDGLAPKALLKRTEAGGVLKIADITSNFVVGITYTAGIDSWVLENEIRLGRSGLSAIPVAYTDAPNLHTADIGVKNTAGTVQRRTHLDPRTGNENQIWDGTNIWHNGTIWKFDDDTKPAYLQIFDMVGNEIAHYHAPANPGFDPTPTKITAFEGTGKMTAGTVPLARVGFSSSFTTPLISAGTILPAPITITHGLGTDDVQVILRGINFIAGQDNEWGTILKLPDGTTLFAAGSGVVNLVAQPAVPLSGKINFNVYNAGTVPAQIIIYYDVLRRN